MPERATSDPIAAPRPTRPLGREAAEGQQGSGAGERELDSGLRLTLAEHQALLWFLNRSLPELEFEVARTEQADFRHELEAWQDRLRVVLAKLEQLSR